MKKDRRKLDGNSFLLLITIALFVIMYIIGIVLFKDQGFAKTQNFLNLFISNAGLIVIAAGMTIVMITGGIDISVGSVVAMVCMILAWCMENAGWGAIPSAIFVLVIGLVFGLVQGWLVAYLHIQPFIVTLAGMFFARGMTAVISKEMISIKNEMFLSWAQCKIYLPFGGYVNKKGKLIEPYIYPSVIIALVVLVIIFVVLKYTKFGRSIYAIGGNEQSALMMGLNVRRTKLKAYVLEGFLASLGGFLFCLNTCSGFVEQVLRQKRIRDGCHCISGYRRNSSDRRCWKCIRKPVRCTYKRYNRSLHYFPGNIILLVDENHHRSNALLLHCTSEYLCCSKRKK